METCEVIQNSGINITAIEILPPFMTFLNVEMAILVEKRIETRGADIIAKYCLVEFIVENGILTGVKLNAVAVLPFKLAVIPSAVY